MKFPLRNEYINCLLTYDELICTKYSMLSTERYLPTPNTFALLFKTSRFSGRNSPEISLESPLIVVF